MSWLLLTPESIRTLSLVILNLAIASYLLRISRRAAATSWLAAFAGVMASFYLMRFIQASVFPLETFGAWSTLRMVVECLLFPVGWGAWAQFAYRFLGNPFPREARAVVAATGLLVAGFAGTAAWVLSGGRDPLLLYLLYAPTSIGLCALAAVTFLRKERRLRRGDAPSASEAETLPRARQAYRSFAGLSAMYAATGVVIGAVLGWKLLPGIFWVIAAIPGVFTFFGGLVVVFVSYAREPTTLQAKLVGLSLATVLAVLGVAVMFSHLPGEMVRESGVLPSDDEAFRFTPRSAGGYEVGVVPPYFDDLLVERIELDERRGATVPLGFSFPYYGRQWDEATIGHLGVVVFGGDAEARPGRYRPYRDFRELAAISPLFGFPMEGVADRRDPEVLVGRAPGRLRISWRFPKARGASAAARADLLLDEGGRSGSSTRA